MQIFETSSNFANAETGTFSLSGVAAQPGDLIAYTVSYRDSPGTNDVTTPTWNGEAFSLFNFNSIPYHRVKTFTRLVTSSATAAVVCTSTTTAFLANASVRVYRGVASVDAVISQSEIDAGASWAAPSLVAAAALSSGDMVESVVSKSGWDEGFGAPATTFSPGGSSTLYSSSAHTAESVGDLTVSYLAATGTPTVSWTASDSNKPVYYHHLMIMRGAAAVSIDSYPTTVRSGQTGVAYATTGFSGVTGVSIGDLAATGISDTAGDGTHAIPALTDEVAHELYGTKIITISGTGGSPATISRNFFPPVGFNFVDLAGTLNTAETGAIYSFSPAAVVEDQLAFPDNLIITPQGNIQGPPGVYTIWHIQKSTRIARSTTLTLAAPDSNPDAISFSPSNNAVASSAVQSASQNITGINVPLTLAVTNGTASVNAGGGFGAFSGTSQTIENNYAFRLQGTANAAASGTTTVGWSLSYNSTVVASGSWVITTAAAADTTPDAFSFNTPAAAALGATVTSSNTTISGINAAAAVSVTGGLVSINGGAFVSSGTITNGQTIAARVTASNSFSTAVTATVNVGGVTAQFTATTIAADTTPDLITFPASTNCAAGSAQASAVRSITGINTSTPITAATNCTYSIAGGAATAADGSAVNNQSIQLFANASNTPGATVNASITIGGQVFTWAITTAQPQAQSQNQSQNLTQLKVINMPVETSNSSRNIGQSTPEGERTLKINTDKQKAFKLLVFVERNDQATGTVSLFAKLITAKTWSPIGTAIDLAQLTEIAITETGGPIVEIMAVPNGVVGSFDLSFAGF